MITYFAFGSNLHLPSFRAFLTTRGIDPRGIANPRRAILHDYALRTNYARASGVGAANIVQVNGGRVEGVLMEIAPAVHDALRVKEGYPVRYDEQIVEVTLPPSRLRVRAMTYIVRTEMQLAHNLPVTGEYRRLILEGARAAGFTKKYQEYLKRVLRVSKGHMERQQTDACNVCRNPKRITTLLRDVDIVFQGSTPLLVASFRCPTCGREWSEAMEPAHSVPC